MNGNLQNNVHLVNVRRIRKAKCFNYKSFIRRIRRRYKFTGLKSIKCEIVFVILILYLLCRVINSIGKCRSDEGTIEGWDYNTSRNTVLYVRPEMDTTLLLPENFCVSKVYVLIMVCSSPGHFAIRKQIRNSWASPAAYNSTAFPVVTYFLVGRVHDKNLQKEIAAEHSEWNDLIQEDFIDSYNNLTIKSLMMLKLMYTHCTNTVRYLMKADDDIYLQVKSLVDYLKAFGKTYTLVGYLMRHSRIPQRKLTSKWFAPCYLYERMEYPRFLSGTGYVMAITVVPQLYKASFNISIFYLEDVYITGLLSEAVEVELGHSSRFTYRRRSIRDPCIYWRAITSHQLSARDIRNHFVVLQKTDLMKCAWDGILNTASINNFYRLPKDYWLMIKPNYILLSIFSISYLCILIF